MGKTLQKLVEDYLTLNGTESYDLLSKKVGKSPMTIRRWIHEGVPNPHAAFKLCRALGCDETEAIRMANEPPAVGAKTA